MRKFVDKKFSDSVGKGEISFKLQVNDLPVSSYLYIKPGSDRLFVCLNGALDRGRTTSLTYHRYSWHPLFPGSVLYIADPTLFKYEDLSLAWYVGDKYTPIDGFLRDFVLAVAENLGVSRKRIVTYGSSGGGFAALQLGAGIEDGVAVCINPQTNIMKYVEKDRDGFLLRCFSAGAEDFSVVNGNSRFNAIKRLGDSDVRVLYVQNETDTFHVKNHFEPFVSVLGVSGWKKTFTIDQENTSRVQVLWYSHESGHAAEPKESVPDIMKALDLMMAR